MIYGYYMQVFLFRRNTIMYIKMYWIQFSIFPFSLKKFHRRDRYLPRVTRETEAKDSSLLLRAAEWESWSQSSFSNRLHSFLNEQLQKPHWTFLLPLSTEAAVKEILTLYVSLPCSSCLRRVRALNEFSEPMGCVWCHRAGPSQLWWPTKLGP